MKSSEKWKHRQTTQEKQKHTDHPKKS